MTPEQAVEIWAEACQLDYWVKHHSEDGAGVAWFRLLGDFTYRESVEALYACAKAEGKVTAPLVYKHVQAARSKRLEQFTDRELDSYIKSDPSDIAAYQAERKELRRRVAVGELTRANAPRQIEGRRQS